MFSCVGLKQRLSRCSGHLTISPIFGHGVVVLLLIVHILLGYHRLQDIRNYQDAPMVHRLLGLKRLLDCAWNPRRNGRGIRMPDVVTVSPPLEGLDDTGVANLRRLVGQRDLEQLGALELTRITLDFDGCVLSNGRLAEGVRASVSTGRRKGNAATTDCFARLPRPDKCLISGIGRAISSTPKVPGTSSSLRA